MILRITKQQEAQIRRLVKLRCANFADGNCLLLDGLEECTCVQLLCKSGIYCRYFLKAVLPQEKSIVHTDQKSKQKLKEETHESTTRQIHHWC